MVVPERLHPEKFDTLVLQGGCNEVSNIKIGSDTATNKFNIWEEKVAVSRIKMFELVENSLKNNPDLKQVYIVKTLPRYDPSHIDPSSIKEKLNKFGNSLYDGIWIKKGCPQNIQIVDQQLDCSGPLRDKRFGNPGEVGHDGKPWDVIHMRGTLAVRHYTNSLIRVLTGVNPLGVDNYHKSSPHIKGQGWQNAKNMQRNEFQYQNRRYRRNITHTRNSRPQNGPNQFDTQHYEYNMGVSNRFHILGNY